MLSDAAETRPDATQQMLKVFTDMYNIKDLTSLKQLIQNNYATSGVFEDPIGCVQGHDQIYRQFAVLRRLPKLSCKTISVKVSEPFNSPIDTTPAVLARSADKMGGTVGAVPDNNSNLPPKTTRIEVESVQEYGTPWAGNWMAKKLHMKDVITLNVTTTLLVSPPVFSSLPVDSKGFSGTELSSRAAGTPRVMYHRDKWHKMPTPPRFLRKPNAFIIDKVLKHMGY